MKRTCHRTSTMSMSELMLIMIFFHDLGYSCLKYFNYICEFGIIILCNKPAFINNVNIE